jgi:hypothetical protein
MKRIKSFKIDDIFTIANYIPEGMIPENVIREARYYLEQNDMRTPIPRISEYLTNNALPTDDEIKAYKIEQTEKRLQKLKNETN